MILIFSQHFDHSTFDVIDWLQYYKKDFVLIENPSKLKSFEIQINNEQKQEIILNIGDRLININEIKTVWYRRNSLSFLMAIAPSKYPQIFFEEFKKFIHRENHAIQYFIFYALSEKYKINSFLDEKVNKLEVLKEAVNVGLLIPDSSILYNSSFSDKFEGFVNKPISDVISFYYEDYMCFLRTQLYTANKQNLSPTLVQRNISKSFEIRVFYLNNAFFSIAMFTQSSLQSKTKIDYRNYDFNNPVPSVPFHLPKDIKIKLKLLIKKLNLKSGSIDLIYSTDNKYYFLEVNALGQFANVSYLSNCYIEKEIAKNL